MSEVENQEWKEFVKNFAYETLIKNQTFTKIYKKSFIKRKLDANIKGVITNEYGQKLLGGYDTETATIMMYTKNKDAEPLKIEDVRDNDEKLSLFLHESIHALFTRDKQYCQKNNLMYACGIVESHKISDNNYDEIGRGLNEGLTNWLCDKCGYKNKAYGEMMRFVFELELALGTENVMKMLYGNIQQNSKILGISPNVYKKLLEKIDFIFEKLYGDSKVKKYEVADDVQEVDVFIFEQFFEKDWKRIMKHNKFSKEEFFKFNSLSKLFCKTKFFPNDRDCKRERFLEQFETLKDEYLEIMNSCVESEYKKGTLTLEKAEELINQAGEIDQVKKMSIIKSIAQILPNKNPEANKELIYYLVKNNRLNEIEEYSIYNAQTKKSNVRLFCKNGEVEFTSDMFFTKNMKAKEAIKDEEKILLAQIENKQPIKVKFQQPKKQILPIPYKSQTVFSSIISEIRNKLFRKPNETVLDSSDSSPNTQKEFREKIVYRVEQKDKNQKFNDNQEEKIIYRKNEQR